ncbi:hypothetical protein HanIR_Chr12g0596421 [Helianthus annuus]|nr:hypothetical protein HanIR_Chr12g0596421 [Helianthus annuus]
MSIRNNSTTGGHPLLENGASARETQSLEIVGSPSSSLVFLSLLSECRSRKPSPPAAADFVMWCWSSSERGVGRGEKGGGWSCRRRRKNGADRPEFHSDRRTKQTRGELLFVKIIERDEGPVVFMCVCVLCI